jgi:hypothetical protein
MTTHAGTDQFTDWQVRPGERFTLLTHVWDVDEAKRVQLDRLALGRRPRVGEIDVAELSRLLQRTTVQADGRRTVTLGVHVDWDDVMSAEVDLGVPCLLAWSRPPRGRTSGGALVLIDGWRRLAKARLQELPRLPAVCLTKAESRRTWL